MPTYEYKCIECGHLFEELHSITADALTDCPACGKPALKRLFAGGTGMIFKGSGFYLTDYKSNRSSASEPSKTPTPKKETIPSDNKSGSAPSTPSTPKTSE
ncbi:MAG: zinc ribbon domain-containing protein [bacterium]